jgi:hypothetical protein
VRRLIRAQPSARELARDAAGLARLGGEHREHDRAERQRHSRTVRRVPPGGNP